MGYWWRSTRMQKAAEDRREREGDDGDSDCGEDGPEEECVPLPEPELAGEGEGVLAGGVEEFVRGERHRRGVEDAAGDADERDDQDQLERIDDVVAELRGGDVEAEDEGNGEAEDCGAAEDGIDADEESGGDAPGQLFGRGSHAEEREDGKRNAAVDPVVVDGSGALAGEYAIWFVGRHF